MNPKNYQFEHESIVWIYRAQSGADSNTHTPEQIFKIWNLAAISTPFRNNSTYKFPTASGHFIDVTPENISIQIDDLTPAALTALMNHAKTQWDGCAILEITGAENREARLMLCAYAKANGVQLYDTADMVLQFALTAEEVVRAAHMAEAIKRSDSGAAPSRPQQPPRRRHDPLRPVITPH